MIEVRWLHLSKRLAAIARFVPQSSRLADIGTDHAYLPIFLIQKHVISSAIAGEVNTGPYRSAEETLKRFALKSQVSLRLGDGLSVLHPGEAETVVIAGMGGPTIINILSQHPRVTQSVQRFIIQPMIATGLVRRWFVSHQWRIVAEDLVPEEGRLYEIVVAEPGCSPHLEDILYDIGPFLWNSRHPFLKEHISLLIRQYSRMRENMKASERAHASSKFSILSDKLEALEARRKCL
ncbi:hypothetical protein P22_0241 [Propionispora sp. 2/2-37]|uniref:tRNA (adenine(22)-N(1))-methyltransferase n=1 Tax=Propionispora sp. 2/2-37 TaxID=1677858 RepID=UPI0006C489D3|nr:class I SAM-dependent methyltransferase [Propionispora sp. 2/2-37]CUH94175.1 hypothetical protein P22_0241 [Propionispora sp. 2/2-37]